MNESFQQLQKVPTGWELENGNDKEGLSGKGGKRQFPKRPSTPCLELTLRMIQKPRKVCKPGVTDKNVGIALSFC